QEAIKKLKKNNMSPVFLTEEEIELYYEGFSNETLWPNFHYFNQYAEYEETYFQAYKKVNQKFADALAELTEEGDKIWVHDYQLLLLPELIRAKYPKISIGFFLHIPFPSYETFRLLPWRRELLMGMLGSDFLGFHTYDDMRHFLSSVNRLAGIGNSQGQINLGSRKILVDALPMGIDYEKYATLAADPDTLEKEVRYRTLIGRTTIMLSIDRLDYSKGIPERLRAFELFLQKHPQYKEQVSLLMVVVPSRDQVGRYKELKEEIDLLVGRINGNFSRMTWTPIHYFYRSFPLNSLSALYRIAKVALVTPMRDGMNLVAKEFIASKLNKKGVLILSEMAGASKELSEAILINPNNIEQMVEAFKQALEMPEEEQIRNLEIMQASLKRYNIHHWVKLFMDRLDYIKIEQAALQTKILDETSQNLLLKSYKDSESRIIFLDYDGTLTPFTGDPQQASPDEELDEIILKLSSQKKNRVVIISGRDKETLEKWFGHYQLDLIAEHGVWLRSSTKEWKMLATLKANWKKEMLDVLEDYVRRTPGSFVEQKDYSMVWHYRKVETGLGELRTRELTSHLKYLAADRHLQVLEGDMVVEIKSSEVNKGRASQKWLQRAHADFYMAIGDDWTDEDTFNAMPESTFTIKVGSTQSAAKYSLTDYSDVRNLLHLITQMDG
ncbi:MAG: bifunctional alpha,alpha-trehalose-phosphate synthase (UDP-forming)/trehalose-phosphatase, partial [Cyclobacteriaceae bacterium]|nr:bifunctional alpha,alpha-trehalose-phosphate synthase (UDP-forming)/trehalose-phosphatase [Cyclobacteriaceae bacterium]